jgi:hypothetical protein
MTTPSTTPSKRGRKLKSQPERLRDSAWAHNWHVCSGKTLGTLDREFENRYGDKKSHRSSGAMSRYCRGSQGPTPPSENGSQVTWAQEAYPGTASVYESFIWDLLIERCTTKTPNVVNVRRLDQIDPLILQRIPEVAHQFDATPFPEFSEFGCKALAEVGNLDALGFLLVQVLITPEFSPAWNAVFYSRQWLKRWTHVIPYLKPIRERFLNMLEQSVPRLGPLLGEFGIDPEKSEAQDRADVSASQCRVRDRVRAEELALEKIWAEESFD